MDKKKMIENLEKVKTNFSKVQVAGHKKNYDWNADPKNLTLLEGDAFLMLDKVIKAMREEEQI